MSYKYEKPANERAGLSPEHLASYLISLWLVASQRELKVPFLPSPQTKEWQDELEKYYRALAEYSIRRDTSRFETTEEECNYISELTIPQLLRLRWAYKDLLKFDRTLSTASTISMIDSIISLKAKGGKVRKTK